MKFNLKYLIIVFILLIAVISSLIGIYYWPKGQINPPIITKQYQKQSKQANPQSLIKKRQEKNKIYQTAIATKDVNKCQEFKEKKDRDLCFKLLALNFKDKKLCNKIKDKKMFQNCQDEVIYKIATENKDLKLCLSINSEHLSNSCAINIISSGNYSKEKCMTLGNKQQNLCLTHILFKQAVNDNNALLCQSIPLKDSRMECLQTVFIKQDNLDFCNSYTSDLKKICQEIISRKTSIKQNKY